MAEMCSTACAFENKCIQTFLPFPAAGTDLCWIGRHLGEKCPAGSGGHGGLRKILSPHTVKVEN